jgi:hypothetical protein
VLTRPSQLSDAPQKADNSCWAATGRSICNWYAQSKNRGPTYASDQEFANAWKTASKNAINARINVQQSAADALGRLRLKNSMDNKALPTIAEICKEIKKGAPLLAMVATKAPKPSPDPNAKGGHWVVIVGIDRTTRMLMVYDPDQGLDGENNLVTVPYHAMIYKESADPNDPWTQFWQNTSYVDPPATGSSSSSSSSG